MKSENQCHLFFSYIVSNVVCMWTTGGRESCQRHLYTIVIFFQLQQTFTMEQLLLFCLKDVPIIKFLCQTW